MLEGCWLGASNSVESVRESEKETDWVASGSSAARESACFSAGCQRQCRE